MPKAIFYLLKGDHKSSNLSSEPEAETADEEPQKFKPDFAMHSTVEEIYSWLIRRFPKVSGPSMGAPVTKKKVLLSSILFGDTIE